MLLIGSRALLFRCPQILNRPPKDFDFISTQDEALLWLEQQKISDYKISNNKIIVESQLVEFELITSGGSAEMLHNIVQNDLETISTDFGLVPSLNVLFTLKASHKYLKNSPHFWKTAVDYHKMKAIGCTIPENCQDFFKLREKETYNYKHPNLNVKKDDFFKGDEVEYTYDHDTIHEAVKQLDKPAYKFYQKDNNEVLCDKNKFFTADEKVRLSGVIEEAAVLAIERSLVPFPNKMNPKQAWMFALSKVCTSITSGWFREYAYDNLFKIVKLYPEDYFDKFKQGIDLGLVKKL